LTTRNHHPIISRVGKYEVVPRNELDFRLKTARLDPVYVDAVSQVARSAGTCAAEITLYPDENATRERAKLYRIAKVLGVRVSTSYYPQDRQIIFEVVQPQGSTAPSAHAEIPIPAPSSLEADAPLHGEILPARAHVDPYANRYSPDLGIAFRAPVLTEEMERQAQLDRQEAQRKRNREYMRQYYRRKRQGS
jgi:hypothetical protein